MLVKQLIQEYSLPYVQAQMRYIQQNAEASVRHMLKELVKKRPESKDGKLVVSALDFMDDGSQLKLTMTVDGEKG